jgi:hypothetical protein
VFSEIRAGGAAQLSGSVHKVRAIEAVLQRLRYFSTVGRLFFRSNLEKVEIRSGRQRASNATPAIETSNKSSSASYASFCRDPMQEHVTLSRLAEDIYDTVLDAGRWTSVLAKVTDFVEGQAGSKLC